MPTTLTSTTNRPWLAAWLADIEAARRRIAGIALHTPAVPSPALAEISGAEVYLKLETLQPTGSFKVRGAASKLVRLVAESSGEPTAGGARATPATGTGSAPRQPAAAGAAPLPAAAGAARQPAAAGVAPHPAAAKAARHPAANAARPGRSTPQAPGVTDAADRDAAGSAELPAGPRVPGVTAFSTGNHGRAVAYVASRLGLRAVICVSRGVPAVKLEAIRRLGAVLDVSPTQDAAEARCARLAAEEGLVPVHPFDDPDVIAGQGTLGLELLEDLPHLEAVIVPLSGGGLLSGVALALKARRPGVRVIGVSMERAPVMFHSLQAGHPVSLPEEPTLADSLVGGIGVDNRWTFRLVRELADDVVLVSEEAIARAMAFMLREHGLLVEGGAATAIAALLEAGRGASLPSLRGTFPWPRDAAPRQVAVVITGRNADPAWAWQAMAPHLS